MLLVKGLIKYIFILFAYRKSARDIYGGPVLIKYLDFQNILQYKLYEFFNDIHM